MNMLLCKALNEQPRVNTLEVFSPTCRFAHRSLPENQFSLSCLVGWVRRLFAFLPARLPTHTNFLSTRESTPKEKNVRSVLEALITAEFVMDFSRTLPIQITHSGIIREITVKKNGVKSVSKDVFGSLHDSIKGKGNRGKVHLRPCCIGRFEYVGYLKSPL